MRDGHEDGKDGSRARDSLRQGNTATIASNPYAVAAELGSREGAVRVMVHRLRRRFREIFREEVTHTLAEPGDLAEEMQHLMAVLAE